MSLTLVQLATAIEQGKTIEKDSAKDKWDEISGLESIFGFYELFPDSVRIKPEPREYWLIPYTDKLGYKVASTPVSQWEPEVNVAGLNFAGIIHVKEVL